MKEAILLRKNLCSVLAISAIVGSIALACSSRAYADGPGWTAVSTVKNIVVTWDGGVNVSLSPELSNCVSNSGYGPNYASIYPSHPGINRMKADLLVASLTERRVQLYLMDNTCRVGEMIFHAP